MSPASDAILGEEPFEVSAPRSVAQNLEARRRLARTAADAPPREEFIQLFHTVGALNTHDRPYVLQFLSARPGEGTSTVARNFLRAAGPSAARQAVLIDCNGTARRRNDVNRPSLIDAYRLEGSINPIADFTRDRDGVMTARLSDGPHPLLQIGAAELRGLFEHLKQSFSVIVLDCPSVAETADSLAMARHCDGTILVVQAEKSARTAVHEATQSVQRLGGKIIGLVFNRTQKRVPAWLRWMV